VRGWLILFFAWIIVTGICPTAFSQTDWEQRKDQDGIKVFTKERQAFEVISYKSITTMDVEMDRLFEFITDVGRYPEWIDGCCQTRMIREEEDGGYRYHTVYDFPWPFRDRHMVVDVSVQVEDGDGERVITLESRSVDETEMEEGRKTRITNFWERVQLTEKDESSVQMITEGFFDPGGNIPPWLTNVHVDDSPIRTIKNLKEVLN
jgi:ribosome-associated toxin RatA of RatAB toxin-antitoxin module